MASQPSNPWRPDAFQLFQGIIRLAVWFALTLNLLMLAVFSVWFVARLLWNLRSYFARVLFSEAW